MNPPLDLALSVLDPLQTLAANVWAKTPAVLAALVLLLVGSFAGRWSRYALERGVKFARMDDHFGRIGVTEMMNKMGIATAPSRVLGTLVYWLIFLSFLLSAANVVQLTVVSEFLQRVVFFMPKLIAAVVVMGGGFFLARLAAQLVQNAMQANRIQGGAILGSVTSGILIVFAALMALQALGIDTSVLANSIHIIVGAIGLGVGLAFGLAFGLAGKDFAANWLRDHVGRDKRDDRGIRKAA